MVSPLLRKSLETMRTSSTTFKGQRGQRVFIKYIGNADMAYSCSFKVIIFTEILLSDETVRSLKNLSYRYEEWLQLSLKNRSHSRKIYVEKYLHRVEYDR